MEKRWRILSIAAAALAFAVVVFFVALHFYVNGDSFKSYLEKTIESSLDKDVSIGSLEFGVLSGVKLKDLAISERGGKGPLLELPNAAVSITLLGLAQRRIESVVVTSPKIYLRLSGKSTAATGSAKVEPLPITLGRLSVEGAEVVLLQPKGASIVVKPIDVTLDDVGGNKHRLEVSARVAGMESGLKISSTLDLQKFTLEDGRIDLGEIDLAKLPDVLLKKFPTNMKPDGVASSSVKISPGDDASLLVEFDAKLSGARLAGAVNATAVVAPDFKSVTADIKADAVTSSSGLKYSHALTSNVVYNAATGAVTIKKFDLDSTLLGKIRLKGEVFTDSKKADVEARLANLRLSEITGFLMPGQTPDASAFGGSLDGLIKAKGNPSAMNFTTDLKISDFSMASAGKKSIDFTGRPIGFAGKGRYAAKGKSASVRLDSAIISIKGLKPISLSGGLDDVNAGLSSLSARITVDDAPVDVLLDMGGKKALAEKMSLHGAVSTEVSVASGAHGKLSGSMRVKVTGAGFSSPDGSTMADGADVKIESKFSYASAQKTLAFDAAVATEKLEFLMGRFYGDFSKKPVKMNFGGEYSLGDKTLRLERGDVSLGDIGRAAFKTDLNMSGPTTVFNAALDIDAPSISKAYDFFIRDTFRESSAMLGGLKISGSAGVKLSASGTPTRFGAKGAFSLKDMDMDAGEGGPIVEGLQIALPFDITYPDAQAKAGTSRDFGLMTVKAIKAAGLEFNALRLEPAVYDNALRLREDVALPLYGGKVRLKNLVYDRLISSDRAMSFGVDVDSLDLGLISTTLGLPLLKGDITGTIPSAIFKGGSLFTHGAISLKLFGGEVRATDMAIEDVTSPAASVKMSLTLKNIDLGQATDAFDFGRVSGVIGGYVNDLVIADGQPESFVARLETVKTRGIPQEISVTALNKISVFGSGGLGGALNKGIYRMFKEYRYSKMGFSGALKNDAFILNGIETSNGRGYLVKGGSLPPMVDVVTYNQKISFKELVERIKRVQQTE